MPAHIPAGGVMGVDFGTTNSVVALSAGEGSVRLVDFANPDGTGSVFRSALCFWQDDAPGGGVAHAAGPWAIAEFLEYPQDTRFLQSFKSVAASSNFEHATLFGKRYRFEDLGRIFLEHLVEHGKDGLRQLPERIVVGRPVRYVGASPDPRLARTRYDAMFSMLGSDIHYVYEPIGAAYSFASRLTEPATLMVADFGWRNQRLLDRPRCGARRGEALYSAGFNRHRNCRRQVRLPDHGPFGFAAVGQGRHLSFIRQGAADPGRIFHRLRRLVSPGIDAESPDA